MEAHSSRDVQIRFVYSVFRTSLLRKTTDSFYSSQSLQVCNELTEESLSNHHHANTVLTAIFTVYHCSNEAVTKEAAEDRVGTECVRPADQ